VENSRLFVTHFQQKPNYYFVFASKTPAIPKKTEQNRKKLLPLHHRTFGPFCHPEARSAEGSPSMVWKA